MLILYTTQATALGGRSGSAASAVKRLRVELSTPQALGGDNGPGTNPEQLFAAGYAGSLLSSIRTVAKLEKIAISHDSNVTAAIGIGPIGTGGGLALAVSLSIDLPGLDFATAKQVVERADDVCPYSNALRGNVKVKFQIN